MELSSSEQSFLMKFKKALRRSLDKFPNCLEVNVLRHQSAFRPDGPESPFVNIDPCMAIDSLMSTYVSGCIGLNESCERVFGEDSIGLGCFCLSKSSALLDSGRIPFDVLFVNSFKAPCILSLHIRILNFLDILNMFVAFSVAFKRSCIVDLHEILHQISLNSKVIIVLLVLLDVLSILKICLVFVVKKLASHGRLMVLLIYMVCYLPID